MAEVRAACHRVVGAIEESPRHKPTMSSQAGSAVAHSPKASPSPKGFVYQPLTRLHPPHPRALAGRCTAPMLCTPPVLRSLLSDPRSHRRG